MVSNVIILLYHSLRWLSCDLSFLSCDTCAPSSTTHRATASRRRVEERELVLYILTNVCVPDACVCVLGAFRATEIEHSLELSYANVNYFFLDLVDPEQLPSIIGSGSMMLTSFK